MRALSDYGPSCSAFKLKMRAKTTPTRPEREGGDSQGPRIAPAVRPMSGARAAPWVDSVRPSWLGDVSQLTGQHNAGRSAALAERLTAQRLRSRGGRGRFRPVRTVARSDDGTPGQVCGFLVTLGYSRYAFLWLCLRQQRLEQVGFEETATFEQIVWDSPVSFDRARVREPFSPHWLASSRTSSSAVPSAW